MKIMATILDLPEMRERVRLWTVPEYEKLGDDPAFKRTELIRGIIVNKVSKSPLHSTITTRLYVFLLRALGPEFIARKEEPLRLLDSMPEPDISVMRGTLDDFATRHPTTADLVVEVAFSSVTPDRENAFLYAEAGVVEYWIVLGETKQVEVYRQPEGGVYRVRRAYSRGELIEGVAVLGTSFAVETLFA